MSQMACLLCACPCATCLAADHRCQKPSTTVCAAATRDHGMAAYATSCCRYTPEARPSSEEAAQLLEHIIAPDTHEKES